MAYVVERGTGKKKRFAVRFIDERGIEVQRPTKAPTKPLAQKVADQLEFQAEQVRFGIGTVPKPPMLFKDLVKLYEVTLKNLVSKQTIEGRLANYLVPAFGEKLIHTIRPKDIDTLLRDLEITEDNPDGLSPQSRKHLRNTLKKVFDFAIGKEEAMRGPNPVVGSDRIVIPDVLKNPVDVGLLAPLFCELDTWWVALFKTAAGCGLRKGELCGLLVSDVDLENRLIRVRRSYGRNTTKGKRERFVSIPVKLLPVLRQQIGKRGPSSPLFPDIDGGMIPPTKKLGDILRTALKRSDAVKEWDHHCRFGASGQTRWGCDFRELRSNGEQGPCPRCGKLLWVKPIPIWHTFKDLRSTFATLLYAATGDGLATQRQMGHRSLSTTATHYIGEDAKRMVALADMMPLGEALAAGYTPALAANGPDIYLTSEGTPSSEAPNHPENPLHVSALINTRPAGLEPTTLGLEGRILDLPGSAVSSHSVGRLRHSSAPAFRRVLQRATATYAVPDIRLTADPFPQLTVLEGGGGLLTVQEVASFLQVSRDTVRLRIKAGDLPAVRMGSAIVRIRAVDLRAMLEKASPPPRTKPDEKPLGEVRLKVLSYIAARELPTSAHEIRLRFGWNSDGTVTKIKRALLARGLIEPTPSRRAGFRVTPAGLTALQAVPTPKGSP